MYLTDYLYKAAKTIPKKPLIIFEHTEYSYADIAKSVETVAAKIHELVGPAKEQQIVGILLANSPEFIVGYLGIVHAGHIAMPLDPNYKQPEISSVTSQLNPLFTVTDTQHKKFFTTKTVDIAELMNATAQPAEYLRLDPTQQYVSMLFTSGTTGNPKATPYSHANHIWNITAVSELWQWTSDDTLLISLPLSHWHGLCVGLTGALINNNTIYLQSWFEPEQTLKALQTGDISLFMHVPIAYSKLIEHKPETTYDLSKVRLCISGSSYLPPAMWQQFKDRFGQEILERYGASEMGFLASNLLDSRIPGCVGKPLAGVEVKLMPSGEIAMRSQGLFNGYWRNKEATDAHWTDDKYWLSGDIGEFDKDGKLHLKGRVQEKMKKFGYTVYPRDVEWALMQNPSVHDAVVMSVQSEGGLNDQFVYFVEGDVSEAEVFAYSKQNMPNFWRPDTVIVLDAIPRTGRASKPALKELRAMIS